MFQMNGGRTSPSPASWDRRKYGRLAFRERFLLRGREFQDSLVFCGPKRGKDFAADTKIGMIHVRALDRLGQRKSHATIIFRSHLSERLAGLSMIKP